MTHPGSDREAVVPVDLEGSRVLMTVRRLASPDWEEDEAEVAGGRGVTLDHVMDGLSAFAAHLAKRFDACEASRVKVSFGCDVAVESGTLVALIGKAKMSSALSVEVEWTK